jgi:hypothetical protein
LFAVAVSGESGVYVVVEVSPAKMYRMFSAFVGGAP